MRAASDKDLDYLQMQWTGAVKAWVVSAVHNCVTPSPSNSISTSTSSSTSISASISPTDPSHPLYRTAKPLLPLSLRRNDLPNFPVPLGISCPPSQYKPAAIAEAKQRIEVFDSGESKGDIHTVYGLLPRLISMLAKARSISKLEFSAPKQCARSADVAFCKAFKLISEESRCFLLRGIVHSIDNCLSGDATYDDGGSDDSAHFAPVSSLEELQDFVQVKLVRCRSYWMEMYLYL